MQSQVWVYSHFTAQLWTWLMQSEFTVGTIHFINHHLTTSKLMVGLSPKVYTFINLSMEIPNGNFTVSVGLYCIVAQTLCIITIVDCFFYKGTACQPRAYLCISQPVLPFSGLKDTWDPVNGQSINLLQRSNLSW